MATARISGGRPTRSPTADTRNSRSVKVGKSDYERTSAGTRGNDEGAPIVVAWHVSSVRQSPVFLRKPRRARTRPIVGRARSKISFTFTWTPDRALCVYHPPKTI